MKPRKRPAPAKPVNGTSTPPSDWWARHAVTMGNATARGFSMRTLTVTEKLAWEFGPWTRGPDGSWVRSGRGRR